MDSLTLDRSAATPPPPPSTETPASRPALPTHHLVFAVLAGFLVEALALRHAPGIGLALAGCGLAIAVGFGPQDARPDRRLIWAAVAAFAAVAVRASVVMVVLNISLGLSLIALAVYSTKRPMRTWDVPQSLLALVAPCLVAVAYGPFDAGRSIRLQRIGRSAPIIRGAVIAVPVLAVFALLFSAADETFARIVESAFSAATLPLVMGHVGWTVAIAVLLVGLWQFSTRIRDKHINRSAPRRGRTIETSTVLVLLNGLFLLFLSVQASYLFGASSQSGVTIAQHARRGFFELVVVAALVAITVLITSWTGHPDDGSSRPVHWLSVTLIGLTSLVLASAVNRMMTYWAAFGLTELRFYTTVFMIWIAVVLAALTIALFRRETQRFVSVTIWSGVVLSLALTLVNPDGLITQTNLSRDAETDQAYLGGLSIDRIPAVVAHLEMNDVACGSQLAAHLEADIAQLEARHASSWLTLTWSGTQAMAAFENRPPC